MNSRNPRPRTRHTLPNRISPALRSELRRTDPDALTRRTRRI